MLDGNSVLAPTSWKRTRRKTRPDTAERYRLAQKTLLADDAGVLSTEPVRIPTPARAWLSPWRSVFACELSGPGTFIKTHPWPYLATAMTPRRRRQPWARPKRSAITSAADRTVASPVWYENVRDDRAVVLERHDAEEQIRTRANDLEKSRQPLGNPKAAHDAKPEGLQGLPAGNVGDAEEITQTRQQIAELTLLLTDAETDRDIAEIRYDSTRHHQQETEDDYALAQAHHASAFTAGINGGELTLGEAIAAQSARGRRSNSTTQTPAYEFDNDTSRSQGPEL